MEQRVFTVLALTLVGTAPLAVPDYARAQCIRVEVCHVPPGDSGVFHTLKVCDHVLPTHLAHGDSAGNCATLAEELCDDGDACTVDAFVDPSARTLRCADVREATDCDDGNECTSDSCDPATGCVNSARTGAMCDDGQICTGPDACNPAGLCEGAAIAGCCTSDTDCSPSLCTNESCDLSLNECVADPVICIPPDLCTASVCDELTGACSDTPVVCLPSEVCDPSVGCVEPPSGCAVGDRYEDQGDGTVLDCATNLVWLKDASCAALGSGGGLALWSQAETAAATLADGTCNLSDGSSAGEWRQPTMLEFCSAFAGALGFCPESAAPNSLINSSVGPPTVVNTAGDGAWTEGNPFVQVQPISYWSSTEFGASRAWGVSLSEGHMRPLEKDVGGLFVWPVRDPY